MLRGKVGGNSGGSLIEGTTGDDENLLGTATANTIYGQGGNDVISGLGGNDTIYAGNLTDPSSLSAIMYGDGGNDTINSGTGFNLLYGSNETLRGVGETDILIGNNTEGNADIFIVGGDTGTYYVGNSSNDYAEIRNFDPVNDYG